MPAYRFRIYFEEDESVYRDIAIRHDQTFLQLHEQILKSYEFDSKHAATFYRSNDHWHKGREISLERYDKPYRAEPLLMSETSIVSEINNPNQKFIYTYDVNRNWTFLVELIAVSKEVASNLSYPAIVRKEGIGPSQYGTKSILGDRFMDVEEKYDLAAASEGFGEEGQEGESKEADEGSEEASSEEEF